MPTLTKAGKTPAKSDETFGQRVQRLRLAKGMASPSDLARAIWGERPDGRGFMVANNRDTIWRYENDRSAPSRKNLTLLAQVLGVPEGELYPERTFNGRSPIDVLECRIIDRAASRYRLVVDLELTGKLAQKVFTELNDWLGHHPGGHPSVRIMTAEESVPKPLPLPVNVKKAPAKKAAAKKAPAKKAGRK